MKKHTISQFIRQTIEEIENGLPENYEISDEIKFEISVIVNETQSAGLDLKVLSIKGEEKEDKTHKIKFSVFNTEIDEKRSEKNLTNAMEKLSKIIDFGSVMIDNFENRKQSPLQIEEKNEKNNS